MINDQIIGETGIVNNIDHNSQTLFFENSYNNPVIFVQPLSYNSTQAAIVRIEDVQSDRFTAFVQETSNLNGWHPKESFSYLVLEQGTWQLEDDTLLEVGTVKSDLLGNEGWENVSFTQNFADDPLVFSQVQTNNDSDFVLTRQRNTDTSGFQLTMQEEEARMDGHGQETLGWLAISEGNGEWSDNNYQAGTTGDNVTDDWHTIDFGNDFSQSPIFLASIASYNESDPSGLRSRNLNSNQADIKIHEDKSQDPETRHAKEVVNFFALDGNGVLKAKGEETEQSPYGGKPWEIKDGARIEAEHFDNGGQDISYSDVDSINDGDDYRITEGVDIRQTSDSGGGYFIRNIRDGEWLEYTTNITGGEYDIKIRVASNSPTAGDVLLKLGDRVLGRFDVKNTRGWQNWETLTLKNVDIPGGNNQILRLEAKGGYFNVNWLEFEKVAPSQELPTESQEIHPTETGNGPLWTVDFENHQAGQVYTRADMRADFSDISDSGTYSKNAEDGQRLKIVDSGADKKLRIQHNEGELLKGTTGRIGLSSPAKEYYLEFTHRFVGTDYDFTKGGKLFGLAGGAAYTGGKGEEVRQNGDGWSARITWRGNGTNSASVSPYVYHAGMTSQYGDDFDTNKNIFEVQPEQDYTYKIHVKMNTGTSSNGWLRIWIDGQLRFDKRDILYSKTESGKWVDYILPHNFHGGNTEIFKPNKTQYQTFDNISGGPTNF